MCVGWRHLRTLLSVSGIRHIRSRFSCSLHPRYVICSQDPPAYQFPPAWGCTRICPISSPRYQLFLIVYIYVIYFVLVYHTWISLSKTSCHNFRNFVIYRNFAHVKNRGYCFQHPLLCRHLLFSCNIIYLLNWRAAFLSHLWTTAAFLYTYVFS